MDQLTTVELDKLLDPKWIRRTMFNLYEHFQIARPDSFDSLDLEMNRSRIKAWLDAQLDYLRESHEDDFIEFTQALIDSLEEL